MANRLVSSPMGPRSYEDFIPSSDWIRDQGYDLLHLDLPGFKKEHLKVQLDSFSNLRITGESHLDGNRWRRFRKEFSLPDNYNTREIRAKFENDMLTITLPKLITEAEPATRTHPTQLAADTRRSLPTQAEPPVPIPPPTRAEHPKPLPARAEPADPTLPMPSQASQTRAMHHDQTTEQENGSAKPANGKGKTEEYVSSGKIGEQLKAKYGVGGRSLGMKMKRNQLFVNVVVAAILLVGLGFYVAYRFSKVAEAETLEGLKCEL